MSTGCDAIFQNLRRSSLSDFATRGGLVFVGGCVCVVCVCVVLCRVRVCALQT